MKSPNAEFIKDMFSNVAPKYDLTNSVLSMGVHHLWRNKVVKISHAKPGQQILDCATGTGDLAFAFKKKVGASGRVVGTDFCQNMLNVAVDKAAKRNLLADKSATVEFSQADVMALPFADNTFDITSISFGIRNVQDPVKGLSEMARVTKPGGRVIVLEFGQPKSMVFSAVYKMYSENILPVIGGMLTGKGSAYKYLQTSSSQFPCREKFVDLMMETNSIKAAEYLPLTGGIAYAYCGIVR